jgi:uncharacterized protein YkwD
MKINWVRFSQTYNRFMSRIVQRLLLALAVTTLVMLALPTPIHAEAEPAPRMADSPYDLVNAVNDLRLSHGLAPYSINPILMSVAQNHADYMAATGSVSHTGAGGSSVTDRLLAAGYPLAGDLSLGGWRSENITAGGTTSSAQSAVDRWTGDTLHLNTMISPNLTEIGAGISENNGRIYYVIDAARPTDSGVPQAAGTPVAGGSPVPSVGGVIIPVSVATPNADGNVIHEVKAGQSLWQIAISYNTKIDEIKRLNNLTGNDIYPGYRLLIRQGVVITPTLLIATATLETISFPAAMPTETIAFATPGMVFTPAPWSASDTESLSTSRDNIMRFAMAILAIAILGGGLVAWWGLQKRDEINSNKHD